MMIMTGNSPLASKEGDTNSNVNASAEALGLESFFDNVGSEGSDPIITPDEVPNYNGAHHNTKNHYQAYSFSSPAFESVSPYTTTAHIQQGSNTFPNGYDLTHTYQDGGYTTHDEYIQRSQSWIGGATCHLTASGVDSGFQHTAVNANTVVINSFVLNYPNTIQEVSHQASSNLAFNSGTFETIRRYSNTHSVSAIEAIQAQSLSNTFLDHHSTPPPFNQVVGLSGGYASTSTTPTLDSIQAQAGSATDFNNEHTVRPLKKVHILERPQLEAWIHEASKENMTITETLEKNKGARAICHF